MSYRDDGFAAQERADMLQHELDNSTDRLARTEAELTELRAQLAGSYAKARFSNGRAEANAAELAALRERLARLEVPPTPAHDDQESGLTTFFVVMISLLLLVGALVAMALPLKQR